MSPGKLQQVGQAESISRPQKQLFRAWKMYLVPRKYGAFGCIFWGRGPRIPGCASAPAGEIAMALQKSDVWFITGCSTGFGRELAKFVLDRGYRAVITARDTSKIQDLTAGCQGRALALKLDVTDRAQVAESVKWAESA